MITITTAVSDIIREDPEALIILKKGFLNLSQYAESINKEVSKRTFKDVSGNSIVIALSRIRVKLLEDKDDLQPQLRLTDITVKSSLVEITFSKNSQQLKRLQKIHQRIALEASDFLILTIGISEIAVTTSKRFEKEILKSNPVGKPTLIMRDLVAVTAGLPKNYVHTKYIIYALARELMKKHINIIETFSTFTEHTFIVRRKDMSKTVEALQFFIT